MVQANALLIIPEGKQHAAEGEAVDAILLDDPVNQEEPAF
jgi:molybdopterin biosynthesis enzyme